MVERMGHGALIYRNREAPASSMESGNMHIIMIFLLWTLEMVGSHELSTCTFWIHGGKLCSRAESGHGGRVG